MCTFDLAYFGGKTFLLPGSHESIGKRNYFQKNNPTQT